MNEEDRGHECDNCNYWHGHFTGWANIEREEVIDVSAPKMLGTGKH